MPRDDRYAQAFSGKRSDEFVSVPTLHPHIDGQPLEAFLPEASAASSIIDLRARRFIRRWVDHLCGLGPPTSFDGRAALLACTLCGDAACGEATVWVTRDVATIYWSDLRWTTGFPEGIGEPRVADGPCFSFDAAQLRAAFEDAVLGHFGVALEDLPREVWCAEHLPAFGGEWFYQAPNVEPEFCTPPPVWPRPSGPPHPTEPPP